MKIGRRKLMAAAASLLVAGLAIAAWVVGGTNLLLAVVLAAVVIGVGIVGYMVAQTERRLRSATTAEIQRAAATALTAISARADEIKEVVTHLDEGLDRKLQRPSEQAEALLRAIKAGYTRLELEQARLMKEHTGDVEAEVERLGRELLRVLNATDRGQGSAIEAALQHHKQDLIELLNRADRDVARHFKHSPAEIDALLQVHRRTKLDDPLPLMGGWAMSPRGLLQTINLVVRPGVSLVVECGSGTSTLFLARALQLKGEGRLVALEHLPEYLELTQQTLKEHDLDDVAEVRHAPLEEVDVDGTSYMWYATTAIADLNDIDLLVVDGPPGSTGTWARYRAYPLLRQRLASSALILVDDLHRRDERSMVDTWLQLGELAESGALGQEQAILRYGRRESR